MTSRAERYLGSKRKRLLDVSIARCALPAANSALCIAGGSDQIFKQIRVGQNYDPIEVDKIRTLDDNGEVRSNMMEFFRRYGIDELTQVHSILNGDMSVTGWRPLTPIDLRDQYEAVGQDMEGARLVDTHRKRVVATKPGIISDFAIKAHTGRISVTGSDAARLRMESEIEYVTDASFAQDMRMIKKMVTAIALRQMSTSGTTIVYE